MTDLWPSRESFGSRLALRPCSPLLSDAGTLQRARSLGGFVRPKFSKTSPDFGFPSAASASVMLREKTPTAGVLSENTRAEYRAAELERVLKEDFAFQNKAHSLKTGFPEMDSYKDSLESGLREEQFRQDHRRTSCSCFSPIACLVMIYRNVSYCIRILSYDDGILFTTILELQVFQGLAAGNAVAATKMDPYEAWMDL